MNGVSGSVSGSGRFTSHSGSGHNSKQTTPERQLQLQQTKEQQTTVSTPPPQTQVARTPDNSELVHLINTPAELEEKAKEALQIMH